MIRAQLVLAGLLLAGCPGVEPVRPDPPPAPEPLEPGPPQPEPATGTPCERANARAAELECPFAGVGFVRMCALKEEDAAKGATGQAWNPGCMETAPSCAAIEDCRSR